MMKTTNNYPIVLYTAPDGTTQLDVKLENEIRIKLNNINHIAIIASDIERSIAFYVNALGFTIIRKVYREERDSWKVDLALNGDYLIELFTFPDAPQRPSYPEALGLRHLAFTVDDIEASIAELQAKGIATEAIRIDPFTGCRCVFFADPDGLPIELVENKMRPSEVRLN